MSVQKIIQKKSLAPVDRHAVAVFSAGKYLPDWSKRPASDTGKSVPSEANALKNAVHELLYWDEFRRVKRAYFYVPRAARSELKLIADKLGFTVVRDAAYPTAVVVEIVQEKVVD